MLRRAALPSHAVTSRQDGKSFVPQTGLVSHLEGLLAEIQQSLYDRALRFRKEHTFKASNYDELKDAVERGFVLCYWAGTTEEEKSVQEETKATIRVIPLEQPALGSVS